MDRQYVVEFVCSTASTGQDRALDKVIGAEEGWVSWMLGPNVDLQGVFTRDAEWQQEAIHNGMNHTVVHEYREATGSRASFLTVRKDLEPGSLTQMVVAVSAIETANEGEASTSHLRIAMGRDTDGLITPTNLNRLRRPGLFQSLHRQGLVLHVASTGQPVDGRYMHVGGEEELQVVIESVQVDRRLPIIMVGMSGDSYDFAAQLARETIGLAQVVTVSRYLVSRADELLRSAISGNVRLDEGGVSVIWPGVGTVHRHPAFSPPYGPYVLGSIMGLLGPLSAVASGPDWLRDQAIRDAEIDRRHEREASLRASMRSQIEAVDRSGTEQARLKAVEDEWVSYIQQTEEERDRAIAENRRLESEVSSLRYAMSAMRKTEEVSGDRTRIDDAPELDLNDLKPLADFLSCASSGRIVFTDEALRSWKRSTYSDAEKMRHDLLLLAKAATEYADYESDSEVMVDDWFRQQGLSMSATDGGLKKKKLHLFTWEGKEYDRLPHIQVNNRTNFEDLARIYFAIDRDGDRFLVDHVGGKLYNPYVNKR